MWVMEGLRLRQEQAGTQVPLMPLGAWPDPRWVDQLDRLFNRFVRTAFRVEVWIACVRSCVPY
jgi:hypothetical protein